MWQHCSRGTPAIFGLLDRWRNLFVWVSIGELEKVSPFVRQANQRHVLRGLFVEAERDCGLLRPLHGGLSRNKKL